MGTHTQVASSFEEEFEAINEKVRRKEREREGGGAGQQLGAQGPGEKKFSGIFKDSHTLPSLSSPPDTPHCCAKTQLHKYTYTQARKYEYLQTHKYTNTQIHKCADSKIHKLINTQIHKNRNTENNINSAFPPTSHISD